MSKRRAESIGRASQMAVAAAELAIADASLNKNQLQQKRVGVYVGTTTGEIQLLESFNDFTDKSHWKLMMATAFPANILADNIAHELGFHSKNMVFANACAASNYALGKGSDDIKCGLIDFALTGGADAISRINLVLALL